MRKILFVLGLEFIANSSKAQNKYLDSTCEWRCFLTGSGWGSYLCTKYFDGDTVVNGMKFFRVSAAFTNPAAINRTVTYKSNMYFLGEDSTHNFVVTDFNTSPALIKVLYHFDSIVNSNIGDQFPQSNLQYPKTCRWWPCDNYLDGYFSDTTNFTSNQIKRKDTFFLGTQALIGASDSYTLGNLCYNGYQGIIEGIGSVCPNFLSGDVCFDVNSARLLYFDKGINRLLICNNPTNTVVYSNFPVPVRGLNHFCSTTTLPLNLLSFTTTIQQNNVLFNWHTANEVNVSNFNIQHSVNGKDFTTIGKVNAGSKEYSFLDELKTKDQFPKTIYYRLEMVDKDGSKTYSTIQQITIKPQTPNIVIYPNPSKDFVTIECAGAKELLIIDYLGRTIKQYNHQTQLLPVNCKLLTKGVYVVKAVMSNGEVKTEKLVVE